MSKEEDLFIEQLSKDNIVQIAPLWGELNSLHRDLSSHFKDHFEGINFSERCEKLLAKEDLGIFVAMVNSEIVGYCIASCNNRIGEIDSLFVKEKYRNNEAGKELMAASMKWLADHHPSQTYVCVSEGNEHILAFYEKYGFRKRSYVLQL